MLREANQLRCIAQVPVLSDLEVGDEFSKVCQSLLGGEVAKNGGISRRVPVERQRLAVVPTGHEKVALFEDFRSNCR